MKKKLQISVLIWALLAIVAIFIDLDLSVAIVNSNSFIGNFTADYGEIPGFLLLMISLFILTSSHKIGSTQWIIYASLSMIPIVTISITIGWSIIVQVALGVILVGLFANFLSKKERYTSEMSIAAEKTLRFVIIVPVILILGIKTIWGRVRFRDLDTNYSQFTDWFIPQGITGDRSFPSGHAGMAWVTVCVIFFVKHPLKRAIALLITSIWVVTVSYGRIVIGAHYFSDVLFSAGISLVTLIYLDSKTLSTSFSLKETISEVEST